MLFQLIRQLIIEPVRLLVELVPVRLRTHSSNVPEILFDELLPLKLCVLFDRVPAIVLVELLPLKLIVQFVKTELASTINELLAPVQLIVMLSSSIFAKLKEEETLNITPSPISLTCLLKVSVTGKVVKVPLTTTVSIYVVSS